MQNRSVDCNGRLALVVDDPVIAKRLLHPAAGEIHVNAQPGWLGTLSGL